MSYPLTTIVIPTAGRPLYLPCAVRSALQTSANEVEVIVVPNGQDESWKQSLEQFASDVRVRVEPISVPHANAARNHGLALARGRYIRFLDDDDYFYPGSAAQQISALEASGADICSGVIDLVNESGSPFKSWPQPETADFVQSVSRPGRITLPTAHVFKRAAIAGALWDETIDIGQDIHWMFSLCSVREMHWCRVQYAVGVWRQHNAYRTSTAKRSSIHFDISAELLLGLVENLEKQSRMTDERRVSAAAGLWSSIHGAFFRNPIHWTKIMRQTLDLFPGSRPDIGLYAFGAGRVIHPLIVETIMAPKRWLNDARRKYLVRTGKLSPW